MVTYEDCGQNPRHCSTNWSTLLLNNHTADQCRQINREEKQIVMSANKLCVEWTSANSTYGAGWWNVDIDQDSEGNPNIWTVIASAEMVKSVLTI